MSARFNNIIMRDTVFAWIALAASIILMVPFLAMQFTDEVKWDIVDFVTMGILLFGMASIFVLIARKAPPGYRLAIGIIVAAGFLYVWAELAVGIFF
jgi:hypothetical protein